MIKADIWLYPPRPKWRISRDKLADYDNGMYFAQPKLNGSCAILYLEEGSQVLWNRHGNKIQFNHEDLHRGKGLLVLAGEYMNKGKKDRKGDSFNGNFVIFDILIHNGKLLEGSELQCRVDLLEELYPSSSHQDNYLYSTGGIGIYKVCNFTGDFAALYDEIIKIDMYEGLVLKRRNGILQSCFSEAANKGWQVKCRKETKNYLF